MKIWWTMRLWKIVTALRGFMAVCNDKKWGNLMEKHSQLIEEKYFQMQQLKMEKASVTASNH